MIAHLLLIILNVSSLFASQSAEITTLKELSECKYVNTIMQQDGSLVHKCIVQAKPAWHGTYYEYDKNINRELIEQQEHGAIRGYDPREYAIGNNPEYCLLVPDVESVEWFVGVDQEKNNKDYVLNTGDIWGKIRTHSWPQNIQVTYGVFVNDNYGLHKILATNEPSLLFAKHLLDKLGASKFNCTKQKIGDYNDCENYSDVHCYTLKDEYKEKTFSHLITAAKYSTLLAFWTAAGLAGMPHYVAKSVGFAILAKWIYEHSQIKPGSLTIYTLPDDAKED